MAGPLTTSLWALWVSGLLPPGNGGPCKRAATLEPTMRFRGRLGPRAGIPKRLRPNCHSCPRGTLEPAWVLHQGEGTQRPQCVKEKGPENPGVAAPLAAAGCRGNCWCDTGGWSGLLAGLMDNTFCRASAYSSTTGYRILAFQSNNAVWKSSLTLRAVRAES